MNALANVTAGSLTPRWDAVRAELAVCARVDEAKDIRDKAMALEAYYRLARDYDAEREAANVRLRAERCVGELLKDLARTSPSEAGSQGGRGNEKSASRDATGFAPSPYAEALAGQGMSRQVAARFQALANIPEETFEAALAGPDKPSTAAILKHANARKAVLEPKVSDLALGLWGAIRALEREGFLDLDYCAAQAALGEMTDAMRADFPRLIPRVRGMLANLEPMNVSA